MADDFPFSFVAMPNNNNDDNSNPESQSPPHPSHPMTPSQTAAWSRIQSRAFPLFLPPWRDMHDPRIWHVFNSHGEMTWDSHEAYWYDPSTSETTNDIPEAPRINYRIMDRRAEDHLEFLQRTFREEVDHSGFGGWESRMEQAHRDLARIRSRDTLDAVWAESQRIFGESLVTGLQMRLEFGEGGEDDGEVDDGDGDGDGNHGHDHVPHRPFIDRNDGFPYHYRRQTYRSYDYGRRHGQAAQPPQRVQTKLLALGYGSDEEDLDESEEEYDGS